MKRLCLLVIFAIFVCGCQNKSAYRPNEKKEKIVNEISNKTAMQIQQELGLIPFGTGGQTSNGVRMLHLGFQCRKYLNIETGRELLIASVEKFMSEVNENESIRPYLANYPFEAKNIEIKIFVQTETGSNFGPETLCVVSAIDGVLKYKGDDPNGRLFTIYSETYEEALDKLKTSALSE